MSKKDLETLTLSNGVEVKIDGEKANGHLLMKCRNASGGMATVIYMIAEIATFNGEKLPAEEILNYSAFDIVALEEAWANLKK